MSVVVGVRTENEVSMASDRLITSRGISEYALEPKVQNVNNEILVGAVGREGYNRSLMRAVIAAYDNFGSEWVEMWTELCLDTNSTFFHEMRHVEENACEVLVATKDAFINAYPCGSISVSEDPLASIGAGRELAIGAGAVLVAGDGSAPYIARVAAKTATLYNVNCGGSIDLVGFKLPQEDAGVAEPQGGSKDEEY